MIKMQSERPLYIGGEVVTEFEVTAQVARELEESGLATPVGDAKKAGDAAKAAPKNKGAAASQ